MSRTRWSASDRALGMQRRITRRDVLQALALLPGAMLLPAAHSAADGPAQPYEAPGPLPDYPPAWTGMRGSNPGSFEVAHALRDGKVWDEVTPSGEQYDLVIVGAGISGLAAAHFFRAQTSPDARILILDNHDDFGGHARRNEFHLAGRLQLLQGGAVEIDSPRPYSAAADALLRALGVDVAALARKTPNPDFYEVAERAPGFFFDRETFGADRLIAGRNGKSWVHFLEDSPLNAKARADLLRLEQDRIDYLPGSSPPEKKRLLSRISYRDYLRDYAKVDPQVLAVYDARTKDLWGVGIDAVSALDCWGVSPLEDIKGFGGLAFEPGDEALMGYSPAGYASTGGSYRYHFPDGNATIARLLVRSLIPQVARPGGVEDIVTARFDYGQLDRAPAPVRLRLRSTVVRARNTDAASAEGRTPAWAPVEITYVRDDRAYRVGAQHCVLACDNVIIPALCPELPAAQKAALHELVRTPLVYSSVAIRSARALHRLRALSIEAPGCYFTRVLLNPAMTIGAYRGPRSPQEPALVFLMRTPCRPGLPEKEQNRAGRAELLATSFETFERNIRDQLGRMLGPGGFDPASDITAITVNRWPHGYAPEYNPLFDPDLPPSERPNVIGRARLGRIAIANSDAGGGAYADVAIDQAHRAVRELLADAKN